MRVLFVTNMYPHKEDPSFGTFVFEQVRALRASGVEIDVLFINGRASRLNYLLGYARFLWRSTRHRYDLVHAHYVFAGLIARAQLWLPVVQSFHGAGEMYTLQGWLCRRLAPRVDAVIVTSRDHWTQLGHPHAEIIPCGVDFDLFRPMPQARARSTLGWPADRKVLLWLGDPRREKRLELVQATYQRLCPLRADLDLRVVSRVPHDKVPAHLNAADVLILTSDHEGSPVVIKEAMACNLPIVSTAVGDVPELFRGVEGCLVAKQDPADLAAKVRQLLEAGQRTKGREAIRHLGSAEEARRIVDVYRKVLAMRFTRGVMEENQRAASHLSG
jgi:glycosyltransferase involved in cell wall biosynthesis